jgi:hypothetical protein
MEEADVVAISLTTLNNKGLRAMLRRALAKGRRAFTQNAIAPTISLVDVIKNDLRSSLQKELQQSEPEATATLDNFEDEVDNLLEEFATTERLKTANLSLDQQILAASAFAMSTSPFQTISSASFVSAIDPSGLEKEIQLTSQQLSDEIRQLQADLQLEANLEAKRREEERQVLERKMAEVELYASKRVAFANEHLDRVSRQALAAIGGFIGILATLLISYSLKKS